MAHHSAHSNTVCLSPMRKKDEKEGRFNDFPCGKCVNCLRRRVSGWSFRLMQEQRVSTSALFVTLTYNTEHVPITKKGYMTLKKDDVQRYMKRLRKLETEKLKYYLCGEYGSNKYRPHYHIILFNADKLNVEKAWTENGKPIGDIFIGDVSAASVGYVLKYICKPAKIPLHANDDRTKEFSLMSKGIGKNYLTPQMIKWHEEDMLNRMYVNLPEGKRAAMPRYYKEKIYTEAERERINTHVLSKVLEEERKLSEEQWQKHEKEKILKAAHEQKTYHKRNEKDF